MKTVREVGVIGQVRVAGQNPVALAIGCLLGGFVPVASFHVAHNEVTSFWSLATALVLGGLVYSAKTVFTWGKLAFSCTWKATGFVVLVEGVMVTSKSTWLALAALAYLVAINAVATGCTLALRDAPPAPKGAKKERKATPVVDVAPEASKPKRIRKPRRVASDSNPPDNTGEFEIPSPEQLDEVG